ncbi:MAG: nucleotide exchange factor GrpE [Cytophagales bacterium]
MSKDQTTDITNEDLETENPLNDLADKGTEVGEDTGNDAITKLEFELTDAKDKYLRLYSEFENFRRRTSKEKMEMISAANEQLMLALIPIADDIERSKANQAVSEDIQAIKDGVNLIFNKFTKTLEQKGLKPLETVGKVFNPDLHEAITQIPAPTDDMKGKIVDEIEKGYFLNDKLIRVAKVVIGA